MSIVRRRRKRLLTSVVSLLLLFIGFQLIPAGALLPAITVVTVYPTAGQVITGETVLVSDGGYPSIKVLPDYVVFVIDGGSPIGAKKTIYGYLINWNSESVADGTHTIVSKATFGNQTVSSAPTQFTVKNVVTTLPVVKTLLPTMGQEVSGTIVLDSDGGYSKNNAPDKVVFSIDNGSPIAAKKTIYGYIADWDSRSVPNGSHSVVSKATFGTQTATSSPILFSVKNISILPTTTTTIATTTTTVPTSTNCSNATVPTGVSRTSIALCDDFNGSSLDRTKWNTTGSWECCDGGRSNSGNGELDYKTDTNFIFANGKMQIQARRESAPNGMSWTSGQIASAKSFTYGYIEERSLMPVAKTSDGSSVKPDGFLSAFWTWGAPGTNASAQETDVYEVYSDNVTRAYLTAHTPGGGSCTATITDPANVFHTYGADIEPSGTNWYIDGKLVCRTASTATQPWNVISYLTVNASFRAPVADARATHAEKTIDYIKVFQ